MTTDYTLQTRLRFDLSGNVGIGTTKPQSKLDVRGAVSATSLSGTLNWTDVSGAPPYELPPGSILVYDASMNIDSSFILADGSTVNRADYPELADVLGIPFDQATFQLPNPALQNQVDWDVSNNNIQTFIKNKPNIYKDSSNNVISGSHLIPSTNVSYDLGSPDYRWKDLYMSGNTIDISGTRLSRHVDGSLMVHDANGNYMTGRFKDVTTTGNMDVSGNISVSNLTTSGNIIVGNNLTVNGTTTTINSTTVTVQDPIITLGSDITNTKDKGIEFKYGASKIGFFGYDDSTGNLTFLKDASNNNEVFSGTQGTIEGSTFKSTVVSGTAPLTVTSTTVVSNLNADLLDGLNSDKFMRTDGDTSSTGNISGANIIASGTISGTRLISTIANGTSPLTVTSSTQVTNLNADLLDGLNSDKFMRTDGDTSSTGTLSSSSTITGTRLISNIASGTAPLTVTSTTVVTNLNADLLDGLNSTQFIKTDGNQTISSATDTIFTVQTTNDANKAEIAVYGPAQGTGRVYVGQSSVYGGGLEYNGDNTPATTGAGADYITLFRRDNNVDNWTARNLYSSNDWEFRGNLSVGGVFYAPGSVIQVLHMISPAFGPSSSAASYQDTGLTLSITPKYATSKIYVSVCQSFYSSTNDRISATHRLLRNAVELVVNNDVATINVGTPLGLTFRDTLIAYDTPNTTSAVTYKTQFQRSVYAGTYGGAVTANYDNSFMTLMEVCQ